MRSTVIFSKLKTTTPTIGRVDLRTVVAVTVPEFKLEETKFVCRLWAPWIGAWRYTPRLQHKFTFEPVVPDKTEVNQITTICDRDGKLKFVVVTSPLKILDMEVLDDYSACKREGEHYCDIVVNSS